MDYNDPDIRLGAIASLAIFTTGLVIGWFFGHFIL